MLLHKAILPERSNIKGRCSDSHFAKNIKGIRGPSNPFIRWWFGMIKQVHKSIQKNTVQSPSRHAVCSSFGCRDCCKNILTQIIASARDQHCRGRMCLGNTLSKGQKCILNKSLYKSDIKRVWITQRDALSSYVFYQRGFWWKLQNNWICYDNYERMWTYHRFVWYHYIELVEVKKMKSNLFAILASVTNKISV